MLDAYEDSQVQISEVEGDTLDLLFRQAEPEDARAILGLIQEVGKETDYLVYGEDGTGLSLEAERALIQSYLYAETSLMLVIEVDGQIIGIGDLATLPYDKQAHVAEVGIFLIHEYWGYGIATMLFEEMLEFAQGVGLKVLTLEVVTENTRAIKLYEKFNFKIVGEFSQRLKYPGGYYDTYLMERIL
ncbi:GNAT family N-acetyltransferase [Suicoccus acidiformans]|uniref:GNAT family N-acetyltransferase n=1 Tax=Suicoccus acidiformans TaxID=2036206 RepID=A0A347WMY4_9LACT|nr:GNAT family protein [Suicoccus acidiformans]AXY26441.1 GNAT family N-acetyltransferase [Suicoccus acidiformans]